MIESYLEFIDSIGTYIDPVERRKGYGKLILKRFNEFIESKDICWVVLFPVPSARYYWKNIRGFSWLGSTEYMIKYTCDVDEPEYTSSISGKTYKNNEEYEAIYKYIKRRGKYEYEFFKSVIEHSNVNPKDQS